MPTWSHDGIICTGETYRDKVKLTFAKGASLDDPAGLFNSSLDGGTRRAIDIREGETIDGPALKALIRRAVDFNRSARFGPGPPRRCLVHGQEQRQHRQRNDPDHRAWHARRPGPFEQQLRE